MIIGLFVLGILMFQYRAVKEFSDDQVIIIKFPNGTISAEVANSVSKKQKGLSGRNTLDNNSGMLFVFNTPDILKFWMVDMKFPLDFVWINGDKIVDVSQNIPAPTANNPEIARINPKTKADKVLEINAGKINELGINLGQTINELKN